MVLPRFGFVGLHEQPIADGVAAEGDWMAGVAMHGHALAQLWEGVPGWVVPRSYLRLPGWAEACARAVADRRPLQVRASGGGLVPVGPGLLNLSLVWRAAHAAPQDSEVVYRGLCEGLSAAFARLGIEATAQAVDGSFCDGRWNLAVDGAKLAGTAQSWRRIDGVPVVLAHAVLVIEADLDRLTAEANAIEAVLGSGRRYRREALTSLAEAWCRAQGVAAPPADLAARCRRAVAEQFARVVEPAVANRPAG